MDKQKFKEIEQQIIDICLKIAKRNEGAIFILGNDLKDYKFLVKQSVKKFNIIKNPKLAESLALMDGAIWFNIKGDLEGYGISMTRIDPILNKGTRHAAASYASKFKNTVFLVSQEDKKVRIFKHGSMVIQIDALEKGIETKSKEITHVLESVGVGAIAAIGLGIVAPTLGIALIPGVIVFGTSHYLFRYLKDMGKL